MGVIKCAGFCWSSGFSRSRFPSPATPRRDRINAGLQRGQHAPAFLITPSVRRTGRIWIAGMGGSALCLPMMIDRLTLPEDVVLLALDEGSGRLRALPDRALDYALAGAFLAELTCSGHVDLAGDEVHFREARPPEDERIAGIFREIAGLDERSLSHVLSFLAAEGTELRERVVSDLVKKGILEKTEEAILWVFHRTRYPAKDHRQEEVVCARLRRAILRGEEVEPSEADVILVGLVHACQLEQLFLSEEELRGNREHIQALARSHIISRTVFDTIQQIHRALLEIRTYSGW